MTNFIERRLYARSAPPAADQTHIGEGELVRHLTAAHLPHVALGSIHLTLGDLYKLAAPAILDAAAAGEGLRVGWGAGDPAWDDAPDDDVAGEAALQDLLGEVSAAWQYVTPNPAGAIVAGNGAKYSAAAGVSNRIFIEAAYAAGDEPAAVIRELGIFLNPDIAAGHEADSYVAVAHLDDIGELLAQDRITAFQRSPATSGKMKIVLKIGDGA